MRLLAAIVLAAAIIGAPGFDVAIRSEPLALAQTAGGNASAEEAGGAARVTGWRFVSTKELTRVMLDLSQQTRFDVRRLKEDRAKRLPARIYIDIPGAKLALTSKEPLTVEDGTLQQVRVAQYSDDIVRVVLDLNELRAHNVFVTVDPTRLVIDIAGREGSGKLPASDAPAKAGTAAATRSEAVQARKADAPVPTTGLRKIVLDPGHGGKDPGAVGVGGVAEKDVVLSIAKKLARKLQSELGVKVILTRNDDRYVPLEDRTALANSEDADLFISLHMNASPNTEARGIETYYLDNTTDEAAIRLAARENRTSRRNISDLQFILSDMMQNMKLEDSITLAHRLQGALVAGMGRVMADVRDLGVKKALFHVLVGARMPSVLVEMSFITHRVEGAAMSLERHQDAMVGALYEGIQKYGQTNMMARTL
jgi:N-acetylmuramoyl-L-alanine amidase